MGSNKGTYEQVPVYESAVVGKAVEHGKPWYQRHRMTFVIFFLVFVLPYFMLKNAVNISPTDLKGDSPEVDDEVFDPNALDMKDYGAKVDIYHIILMYENLKATAVCTPETVLQALFKGGDQGNKKPAEVWVWLSHLDQQQEIFDSLDAYIAENKDKRDVTLRKMYLDFDEMIAGTPFEEFYKTHDMKALGKYGDQNKGNALRLVIVKKYGGFYMDADMLVVNDPSILMDGVAMQGSGVYNNAAFKFSIPDHPVLDIMIDNFIEKYNGNKWGQQGPLMFSRVIKRVIGCKVDTKTHVMTCPNIEAETMMKWGTRQIYPLAWYSGYSMGKSYDFMVTKHKLKFDNPHTTLMIHLWHKHSKLVETRLCREGGHKKYISSFIGIMKEKHCPITTKHVFAIKEGEEGYCEF